MNKPKVYISYAWGGESEQIVDEICKSLPSTQFSIIRDKKDLEYKGNIEEFMQKIGIGQYIIIVISDRYLKSENCMHEMVEIESNKQEYKRIFPILLDDADIYRESNRTEYHNFWEKEHSILEKKAKEFNTTIGKTGVYETINLYTKIIIVIDKITLLLRKMNVLSPEIHRNNNFLTLFDAIEKQYREDYNIKPIQPELVTSDFIGKQFNSYIITEYINSGGFGSVYKAKHATLINNEIFEIDNEIYAIKISHQITRGYRNINKVIELGLNGLKNLTHPNIVKFETLFEVLIGDEKRLAIVMEYVPGGTIKDLKKDGLTREESMQRMSVFAKICDAILYAHTKKYKIALGESVTGLKHGDIKPTNVLITTNGEPKLMDFMFVDLNKLLEIETKTPSYLPIIEYGTRAIGTDGYMAPEQVFYGEVDEQTDIFSLGILLFELFSTSHHRDFYFNNASEIESALSAFNSNLPADIAKIIFKATRPERNERYSSVQEIIKEIKNMQW